MKSYYTISHYSYNTDYCTSSGPYKRKKDAKASYKRSCRSGGEHHLNKVKVTDEEYNRIFR